MCIIVVESKFYRIFVLLLCQLLPKSVFFLTNVVVWLGMGLDALLAARRKKSTRSSCSREGVEPELVMRHWHIGLDLKDHAQRSRAQLYKPHDTVIAGAICDGEDKDDVDLIF